MYSCRVMTANKILIDVFSAVDMSTIVLLMMQILVEVLFCHSAGILDTLLPRTVFSEN